MNKDKINHNSNKCLCHFSFVRYDCLSIVGASAGTKDLALRFGLFPGS